MSQVLALVTQDAALVRCELDRVRHAFEPRPGAVVGLGAWQEGQVVQRIFAAGAPCADAFEAPDSEVVLLASRHLGVGQEVDHGAAPFRFRQWLFAATGDLVRPDRVREQLRAELPEFLQSVVRAACWEEAAFARFLAELRTLGRMDDPRLDVTAAAACLSAAARAVEQVSAVAGVTERPAFGLVASNGHLLVATGRGGHPVAWTALEGRSTCARHGLGPHVAEAEVLVRDHRRQRSVAVATGTPEGWVRVPEGATLAVDRRLAVTVR